MKRKGLTLEKYEEGIAGYCVCTKCGRVITTGAVVHWITDPENIPRPYHHGCH